MNNFKGLQFLSNKKNGNVEFEKYEDIFKFLFPPIFKIFCKLFELDVTFNAPKYYHPEYDNNYYAGILKFKQLGEWPISISRFDNLDNILENWKREKNEKEWIEHNLLKIVDIDIGGGIYLGINGEKEDKIFLVVWDWDEDYILIANNIFDFMDGLELIEDESALYGYKYNQLYRIWGEEFWKIKKE